MRKAPLWFGLPLGLLVMIAFVLLEAGPRPDARKGVAHHASSEYPSSLESPVENLESDKRQAAASEELTEGKAGNGSASDLAAPILAPSPLAQTDFSFWGATPEEAERELALLVTRRHRGEPLRKTLLAWSTGKGMSDEIPVALFDPAGDGGLTSDARDDLLQGVAAYDDSILRFHGDLERLIVDSVQDSIRSGGAGLEPFRTGVRFATPSKRWAVGDVIAVGDHLCKIKVDLEAVPEISQILAEIDQIKLQREVFARTFF